MKPPRARRRSQRAELLSGRVKFGKYDPALVAGRKPADQMRQAARRFSVVAGSPASPWRKNSVPRVISRCCERPSLPVSQRALRCILQADMMVAGVPPGAITVVVHFLSTRFIETGSANGGD